MLSCVALSLAEDRIKTNNYAHLFGGCVEKESERDMTITTFKNMKGMIHGSDPKRIGCDNKGVLVIGYGSSTEEVKISPEADSIMPTLFHGATGDYPAIFTDEYGNVYDLGKVAVRSGRIASPPPSAVEIMELHCRADSAEDEREALRKDIEELKGIFDTNSLNFLIK